MHLIEGAGRGFLCVTCQCEYKPFIYEGVMVVVEEVEEVGGVFLSCKWLPRQQLSISLYSASAGREGGRVRDSRAELVGGFLLTLMPVSL